MLKSAFGPEETMNRFEALVRASGMQIFAHVDHAAGADGSGRSLRPTELLVFGSTRASTPLIEATQTIAIDLPLKTLVWQDENGVTWIAHNELSWIADRHNLASASDSVISSISGMVAKIASGAAGA